MSSRVQLILTNPTRTRTFQTTSTKPSTQMPPFSGVLPDRQASTLSIRPHSFRVDAYTATQFNQGRLTVTGLLGPELNIEKPKGIFGRHRDCLRAKHRRPGSPPFKSCPFAYLKETVALCIHRLHVRKPTYRFDHPSEQKMTLPRHILYLVPQTNLSDAFVTESPAHSLCTLLRTSHTISVTRPRKGMGRLLEPAGRDPKLLP